MQGCASRLRRFVRRVKRRCVCVGDQLMRCCVIGRPMAAKRLSVVVRRLFGKHLLLTNTVVSGGLAGLGDVVQQNLERLGSPPPKGHDWHRTRRMATVGLVIGPVAHGWYKFLDGSFKGSSVAAVVKKVLVDQLVASPVMLSGFFVGMGTMEGKSLSGCIQEIRQKFVFSYLVEWCFWPPYQFLNFRFLPEHFRVVCVSFAILIWNVFLSYVKHKDFDGSDGASSRS